MTDQFEALLEELESVEQVFLRLNGTHCLIEIHHDEADIAHDSDKAFYQARVAFTSVYSCAPVPVRVWIDVPGLEINKRTGSIASRDKALLDVVTAVLKMGSDRQYGIDELRKSRKLFPDCFPETSSDSESWTALSVFVESSAIRRCELAHSVAKHEYRGQLISFYSYHRYYLSQGLSSEDALGEATCLAAPGLFDDGDLPEDRYEWWT